jgi:hypothetical protein
MTAALTILAAALAASISGAAMAGELNSQGNQTGGTTLPSAVAAPAEPPAPNTAAAVQAVSVYLQSKGCHTRRDTLLPPNC